MQGKSALPRMKISFLTTIEERGNGGKNGLLTPAFSSIVVRKPIFIGVVVSFL